MKRYRKIYNPYQLLSAVFMILALLWLTISAPFVYASFQEHASQNRVENTSSPLSVNEEDANPFSNTTEEKSPNSSSFSEEYLHDHHASDCFFSIILRQHKCENADIYHAFHGELLVPPPNAA
jgi:hypothetical protein